MALKTKEEQDKIKKLNTSSKKTVENKKSAAVKVDVKDNSKKETKTVKKSPSKTSSSTKSKTSKKVISNDSSETKAKSTKKSTKKSTAVSSNKKTVAEKKSTTKKTTLKTVSKKDSKIKKSKKTSPKIIPINPIEYYDLPYRYNQTVVKVLAQNPNTLFVYWDVSDSDRDNFEKLYGKDFFYKTKPVLVIHNLTNNYTFEIDINDFANNWYVNVNDTKCKYLIELGRRPIDNEEYSIPVNYLNVAFSNTIEIPNDHILFFKENDRIYFKNIKTNKVTEKIFKNKTYYNNLKSIYQNYNLSEENNKFDFKNPSSQNPTSVSL